VVRSDSNAELRPVTTGQRQGEMIVIEKGLKAGERVVTTGQLGVTPDAKVQIRPPESESSAPAGDAGGAGES
jgi:multidrug efflux system membrane fusion protein